MKEFLRQNKPDQETIARFKLEELKILEEKLKLVQGLPHLHGWKWYTWAKKIFESRNKEIFCTAANQCSKSSTAIRKNIELATNPSLWLKYWPDLNPNEKPNQFWYFYPSLDVATVEFETKWEPLFLPRNEYKKHPTYGWKEAWSKGKISEINFNTGVTIYFKSYEQSVSNLQTGTVYHITLDEECPVELLPELQARLNASDGYLLSVFTATIGQTYWEKTMEPSSPDEELHKEALKIRVSLYDCLKYEDGTNSHWDETKIKRAEARCGTQSEIDRRIHGRFVRDEGLRFQGFDKTKNIVQKTPIPRHWLIYAGVDPGAGGAKGHPTGIVFVAVNPSFKEARVFRVWRGDKIETVSQDVLNKFRELRGQLRCVSQVYDYANRDFYIVSSRQGESFVPANKDRDSGIGLLNTLFKNGMLKIQISENDFEMNKLVSELRSLTVDSKKNSTKTVDDLTDALRYVADAIPWDFSQIGADISESEALKDLAPEPLMSETDERRARFFSKIKENNSVEEELDFWNDVAGT